MAVALGREKFRPWPALKVFARTNVVLNKLLDLLWKQFVATRFLVRVGGHNLEEIVRSQDLNYDAQLVDIVLSPKKWFLAKQESRQDASNAPQIDSIIVVSKRRSKKELW